MGTEFLILMILEIILFGFVLNCNDGNERN